MNAIVLKRDGGRVWIGRAVSWGVWGTARNAIGESAHVGYPDDHRHLRSALSGPWGTDRVREGACFRMEWFSPALSRLRSSLRRSA